MCGYSGITHEYHVITCVNVLSHAQTPHFHASQSPGIDEKIPFTLVKSRYCVCFVDILVMARLLSKLWREELSVLQMYKLLFYPFVIVMVLKCT